MCKLREHSQRTVVRSTSCSGQGDAEKETSYMKRLLYSLTRASVATVIILAGNNAVGASDKQTLDPAQNTAEKGSDIPAQADSQKEGKSGPTTKINGDSEG